MKTLGGALFVYRGIDQDYCFREAIHCLFELCDDIAIVAGGPDGTFEAVHEYCEEIWKGSRKTVKCINLTEGAWNAHQGREKLSVFTNMAIDLLKHCDFVFTLQADEIIHQDSFKAIRAAIEWDVEAYLVRRINLWGDPYHQLDVPQERKPCSTEVIRLAKPKYHAVGDAESIEAPAKVYQTIDTIRIYHLGFVRDSVKHLVKIKHMQGEVFQIEVDKRVTGMEKFDPSVFFAPEDLKPITEELPVFVKYWAASRIP